MQTCYGKIKVGTTATEIMYYANGAQDGLEVSENETSNLRLLYDYLCS